MVVHYSRSVKVKGDFVANKDDESKKHSKFDECELFGLFMGLRIRRGALQNLELEHRCAICGDAAEHPGTTIKYETPVSACRNCVAFHGVLDEVDPSFTVIRELKS